MFKLAPGTVMYSEDWLNQCLKIQHHQATIEDSNVRKFIREICSAYQMGSTLDPILIYDIMKRNNIAI